MIGKKFSVDDLDLNEKNFVKTEGTKEADRIWNSPYTTKKSLGGTDLKYEDVLVHSVIGKIGEYLIEKYFNYSQDTAQWHDLISPDGVRTEVKTWTIGISKNKILNGVNDIKKRKNSKQQWFFSTEMIVILYNPKDKTLLIEGIYQI